MNIYGGIGYSYLQNIINDKPKNLLIIADNHSKLTYCTNYIKISDWLLNKTTTNNILLEEVPRDDVELKELFNDSDHTRDLKNLFLENSDLIQGIDIRPTLIKYSWELIELSDENTDNLKKYLELIDLFFNFKHIEIAKNLGKIYTLDYVNKSNLKLHFNEIKKDYDQYIIKYNKYLDKSIVEIFSTNKVILEEINSLLNNIMEYFIISKIFVLKDDNKNIIIHCGLFHSQSIIKWLLKYYNYMITDSKGINNFSEIPKINDNNGCLTLNMLINDQLSKKNF
jgi:hypothetical protein